MEVAIQGWAGLGQLFSPGAVDLWNKLHAEGYTHIAPIGGSDDHHGGNDSWPGSPIGNPTTMVWWLLVMSFIQSFDQGTIGGIVGISTREVLK